MKAAVILTMAFAILSPGAALGEDTPWVADEHTALLLHLDGDANDSSANRIQGQVKGPAQWADGRFGKALALDGSSAVLIPAAGPLYVGESNWTLEFWMKPGKQTAVAASVLAALARRPVGS